MFINLLLDRFRHKLRFWNGSDDTKTVAGRNEEYRHTASHYQPLLNRFMAVTVAECELTIANHRRHNGAVRARSPVQYRVTLMRAKDTCGISFGLFNRSAVVEQRPQCTTFDTGIGTEQILTEEIKEFTAYGCFSKSNATLVTRGSP